MTVWFFPPRTLLLGQCLCQDVLSRCWVRMWVIGLILLCYGDLKSLFSPPVTRFWPLNGTGMGASCLFKVMLHVKFHPEFCHILLVVIFICNSDTFCIYCSLSFQKDIFPCVGIQLWEESFQTSFRNNPPWFNLWLFLNRFWIQSALLWSHRIE